MPNTVVFLWISAGIASHSATADLLDFGASRGLSFAALSNARPAGLPVNEQALVLSIEGELEQARTALSALEEARAVERLSRVEADLLAHPYLPQATFLMGECWALQAQAARAHTPTLALDLEERRQALEGPRALEFGESAPQPAARATSTRVLAGLAPSDDLELDGAARAPGTRELELSAGIHHVRVFRHGQLIFAQFVVVAPSQKTIELAVPALIPCSAEDLEGVAANQPIPRGVSCERWAQVRADTGGGVGVALCERDHCGAFTHWQRREPAPFRPIAIERSHLPSWAGFALAGVSVLAASGIVLWQAGAFDHGHPTATTWEYGGLNPQAVRF
ncbi:MAG TPA: hypothetical protein VHB79_08670 [Polyangiaceae bacterium]|nr:hypothetical protein [Polyangiaceae bacterium]